jgi:hypothetical protein
MFTNKVTTQKIEVTTLGQAISGYLNGNVW